MSEKDHLYLTEVIKEVDNLPCSHPASVNIDVANTYCSLTKMLRPLLVVEIGCFIGFSTLHFAQALKELGFGKIISIDAFDWEVDAGKGMQNRQEIAEYYRKMAGVEDIITYIKGYSTQVYSQIADQIQNQIDLLYIDGDHSIKGVFADFNTYYNDVRVGGYLILHDIYPSMCDVDGPRALIDHFNASEVIPQQIELIEMQTRDGFGIAILRKKSDKPIQAKLSLGDKVKIGSRKHLKRIPLFSKTHPTLPSTEKFQVIITVVDAQSGKPISGAEFICPQRCGEQRITGEDGNVYLDHYLPNRYLIDISAKGYTAKRDILLDISADKPLHTFTIELEAGIFKPKSMPQSPESQFNPQSIQIEWALFERMRLAAQVEIQPANDFMPQTAADEVAVRVIPPDDFNASRLFAEMAALPENGGEVYLPAGRIELTETLKLRTGVHLVGVLGKTELVFKEIDFGLMIQGDNRVRVENVRIRHQGAHKFCAAIFATRASDILFSHVEIFAPRAVGFLFSDGVYRARLEQCAVYEAGLVGFMMVRDVRESLLQACVAERCQQGGVFMTDLKLPPEIDPLDFQAQIHYTAEIIGNFGPFAPEDPAPYRNTLINCSFRRNRKVGITTDGVGYLRVLNCIIADNDCEGITIDNGSWGCQVQNCHIYNNGRRGLQHEAELTQDFVETMGLMPDGTSKAKLPGISLDNAAYSRIENNCIEGNWGDGVKFVRSVYGCTVAHNLIANNNRGVNDKFHFFGVLIGVAVRQHPDQSDFPSCYNRIIENDILGSHYAGVHLLPHTTGNIVQANRIVDQTFMAVEDHTSAGNRIQENGM